MIFLIVVVLMIVAVTMGNDYADHKINEYYASQSNQQKE